MAYTLKSTGIATSLTMCVAVNQDGVTATEFVSSTVDAQKTVDGTVTVGNSTWKGNSRGYFATGSTDTDIVHFGATKPAWDTRFNPLSVFIAVAGMSSPSSTGTLIGAGASTSPWIERSGASGPLLDTTNGQSGSTSMPTDNSTKFSVGRVHNYGGTTRFFYGLESGSFATDGTSTDGGNGGIDSIYTIGGVAGTGRQPAKYHIVATFNVELTLAQFQSLHGNGTDDWFSTLFNSPFPPLGFGKISSNRKYFLPSEAAIVLAALESKRRLSRRRFFQWLPGAFWRK